MVKYFDIIASYFVAFLCNRISDPFQSQTDVDPTLLMSSVGAIFGASAITLIYCEFAERVSSGFDEICDMICELHWYLYAEEIQKMMPTIIVNSQEPVNMDGFANCSCSRVQFKKVKFIHIKPFYCNVNFFLLSLCVHVSVRKKID